MWKKLYGIKVYTHYLVSFFSGDKFGKSTPHVPLISPISWWGLCAVVLHHGQKKDSHDVFMQSPIEVAVFASGGRRRHVCLNCYAESSSDLPYSLFLYTTYVPSRGHIIGKKTARPILQPKATCGCLDQLPPEAASPDSS